jgi:DNA-binding MarR family transcriptional regulator
MPNDFSSPDQQPAAFDETLGFQVRDLHRAIMRMLSQRLSEHGMHVAGWYFLRVLWQQDGLTQRELAARVGTVEPTAVTALRALEQQGYIRRERNASDRRKSQVFLTDAGRALRETLLPISNEVNEAAAAALAPAERQILMGLLRRARSGMPG